MSAFCFALLAAGVAVTVPHDRLTLKWMHSVERTGWEEDYEAAGDGLLLVQARVRRSGAGMEPGQGAVWRDGWWHYRPQLPSLSEVSLANSEHVGGYEVCWTGRCRRLSSFVPQGTPATLRAIPCAAGSPS